MVGLNHASELGLAHDLFEEAPIQPHRHIDAGVQHVHRNGNLRQLVGFGELVDGALGICHAVVDDLGPVDEMRILFPEYLQDLFRVGVVLGEDNRLTDLVAATRTKMTFSS